MKKNVIKLCAIFLSLFFIVGCSQKDISPTTINKKSELKKKDIIVKKDKKSKNSDLEIEVKPIVNKKMEIVTKVKPEVAVVGVDKIKDGEIPVVVVDPVEEKAPVKEVEVLPVVDNTVGVITKVQPTIEVVEEIPVKDENTAVVIEPIVE